MHKKALDAEKERLKRFKYEFFSVNSGAALYKGAGTSLKRHQVRLKDKDQPIGFMDVA